MRAPVPLSDRLPDVPPADKEPSPPDSQEPEQAPRDPKQYHGLPDPVDPRLLLIANPDGSLKPEFQDWEQEIELEAGSLMPVWWPQEQDGQVLSPQDREASFAATLDGLLKSQLPPSPSSSATSRGSDSASPTPKTSMPQLVLKSLLRLRSAVLPE